jgi:hypothetical protein
VVRPPRVYEWAGNRKSVSDLAIQLEPTAVYQLAAPSTPEPARQEVLAKVEAGERVTPKAVKAIVAKHKPSKRTTKPKTVDGDREPAKPKRSLLDAMGAVGAFTPASAKRYCAEHPDEAKRTADAASVVAKIAGAVAPSPSSAAVEPESVVRNTGESETPGPLVATIIKAQEVLAGMAKVADAAEAGDRKALETVIAGAKLLTSLCVRMEQLAEEYARPDLRLVEPEEGLSPTKQWMQDHSDDVPCPRDPDAAKAWRQKRGIQPAPEPEAEQRISPRTGKPVRKYTKRNSNSAGY